MVCCCTLDEENQLLGCVLFHSQCGCCPIKCCNYDDDGMCWGCVICRCQIDPCWLPRQTLHLLCACVPCGCIPETLVITLCCCHPGNKTMGEVRAREEQRQKERSRLAAAQTTA